MTPPNETTDQTSIEQLGTGRRPLLKILGTSAALSLESGVAAAHDGDSGDNGTEGNGGAEIDPRYGFSTPNADNIPGELEPDHEVELHIADPVPENHGPLFHFEPTGLAVEEGDIVQFTFTTPDHTITAYHPGHGFQQRVPDGVPPFSSPVVNAGGGWLYQFEEEGLYDLYCAPHHPLGMTMRIVVGELDEGDEPEYEDTFEGTEDPPLLPPFSKEMLEEELEVFSEPGKNVRPEWVWLTPAEVLDTEVLDPGQIQAEGSVPFSDVLDEISRIETSHGHE
ncbi:plastocyanin/azurin family copper-binding protein [Natrinema sp. SYSU A 869]|uniref:cupredoxin domain-containing protein n=1 Tax=Natrinema sp. SYSU A 869 TaxID=2871694 RepID=UPI001CA42AA4|nr:plastocyanin/azurin family copper-binding protein [Natrinema sp. SYSU A 869]